jgi:hypothetical protein
LGGGMGAEVGISETTANWLEPWWFTNNNNKCIIIIAP